MSYFFPTTDSEAATGQLQETYHTLTTMFKMVPKVFVAQSMRPDLLKPIVNYLNRLMANDHALTRSTKALMAAYVSKRCACAY
jgi:hypothetical protein